MGGGFLKKCFLGFQKVEIHLPVNLLKMGGGFLKKCAFLEKVEIHLACGL